MSSYRSWISRNLHLLYGGYERYEVGDIELHFIVDNNELYVGCDFALTIEALLGKLRIIFLTMFEPIM